MGRNFWAFAGVAVAVAAVGQYVHARSAKIRAIDPACHIRTDGYPTTGPDRARVAPLVSSTAGGDLHPTPYENTLHGIRFNRPAGWVVNPSERSILFTDPKSSVVIHLDVPKLPVGAAWIPMGMVTSGYVDDLKKHDMPDATPDPAADVATVPAATGRRLCCHGHAGQSPAEDSAVFLVHDHRIFVLSVDSNQADAPRARAALDAAVASIQWLR